MASAPSAAVDLRPLSLSELLDRSFTLYRNHFLLFVGITAIPQLFVLAISLPFGIMVGQQAGKSAHPGGSAAGIPGLMGMALGFVVIAGLVALIATIASEVATTYAVSDIYLGRAITIRQAYGRVSGKIGRLIWLTLLMGMAIGAGFILLVIPGIIIACRTWVAVPAALLEDLPARRALDRSFALTKGDAGKIFVVLFLLVIVGAVASSIFQYPFTIAATILKEGTAAVVLNLLGQLGGVLAQILVGPVALITSAVFYYDLRVRKEAFDLQVMLTALPGVAAGAEAVSPAN